MHCLGTARNESQAPSKTLKRLSLLQSRKYLVANHSEDSIFGAVKLC
jgi:hypothetical protein